MGPWQPLDPIRPSSVIVARPSLQKEESNPADSFVKRDNDFLYIESKRARIEKEREERRSIGARIERERASKRPRYEEDIELDSSDIALATVPGQNFDPKERCFDIEELRPQPIIRKRKKTHVPEHEKDEKYWEKRSKNTEATKRAREAKRLKENQIVLRAAFLETENKRLTDELERVSKERDSLQQRLNIHEKSPTSVKFNCLPSDVVNTLYVDNSFNQADFVEVSTLCPTTTDGAISRTTTDLTSIQPVAYNSLNYQVECPVSIRNMIV